MSNFNQYFKNTGAKTIVDKFFEGIDLYTEKYKMTDLTWKIQKSEDYPASYYIENGLTATHTVELNYTINYGSEVLATTFEVPKEIDGAFIIEGAYRIATNTLSNDYDCRINMSATSAKHYDINFDYFRVYDIKRKVLIVRNNDQELSVSERVKEYPYDKIDSISGLEKEALRLTPRQITKLQVKLDLDYKPEFITTKLINECIAFGDDHIRDLIIDKKIDSVPTGFMNYLFGKTSRRSFYSVRRKITSYWTKYHRLPDPVKYLTMLCLRYWKGSSNTGKGGSDLQISPGINAINLQSLTNKIVIPQTVAYNKSFTDLICVGATPINQNVNKQNALTVSTHITDNDILFDVYDKNFQKITISYLDYLNHKVCSSEFVDYETKTVKPSGDGTVEVKYRLKRKTIPADEIELIDLHPDYRLSEEVRRIPFVNYTDSVRIHMGSSMLKQAIALPNAERPLVDTGNMDELNDNVLNEKFKFDEGIVKEITEDNVVIELPDGDTTEIPRRTAIQSVNDVDVFTEPKVKVGQKVKKGDVITGAVGLEKDTYKTGINALVLFHAMFGYVNEDALVVSESFSKKMYSNSIIDLSIDVKSTEALKWIAPIGTKVKSKDSVVIVNRTNKLDEINKTLQDKLGGIFGEDMDFTEYMIEVPLIVPNNIDEAYVSDVIVQENTGAKFKRGEKKPDLTYTHTTKDVVDAYKKNNDRKIIYDTFPEYVASDTLKPVSLADKNNKVVYTVRVRLIKRTNLLVGSKVTNRYGGKGVISKILPDNLMPVMVDSASGEKKICDIVMNPYSTINRKIPSVNLESGLGNIAHRIHDIVEERKNDLKDKETILPLVQKYYPGRFDAMTADQFIEYHNTHKLEDVYYFNVGSFSTKFTPELVDEWSDELGVTPQSKILMPTEMISDLGELKENLSPEEYDKVVKGMKGKYTEVDKPLMVGYLCMEELYHIPTYSNKVTSSMFGEDINEFKDSPIMGRGAYRTTGQKIGEMELSAYLSRGAKKFIEGARGDTAQEDNQIFLNNLLGLGLTVTDEKGYNQGGSSLKGKLSDMKIKFRLKNQK